jgi:hypothetical protein
MKESIRIFALNLLLQSTNELHETPFGTIQQFVYCLCRME